MSLSQGSLEPRSLLEVGKLEAGAEAEVSTQKSWSSEKNWSGLSQGPGTASREQSNKLCIPTDVHGEKKKPATQGVYLVHGGVAYARDS